MTKLSEQTILEMARVIHLAKIKSCCFPDGSLKPGQMGYGATWAGALKKQPFPEIHTKEFRTLRHHGQSWIEIAIDQAKAVAEFLESAGPAEAVK